MVAFINWSSHETGVRRKDWKGEEEASVVFLRATSYQHAHASEVCPGRLARQRGAVDLTDAKRPLSKSVGYHCGCSSLQPFPKREKLFETRRWSSGVRGSGSLQHEAAAHQPLVTFLHVETEPV